MIALLLTLLVAHSFASGFSQNADAIENAAQSVLMLYVFDAKDQLIGTGSGFSAIDSTILITNYHVIEDAHKIVATSDNGLKYSIDTVLCADKDMDIAIIGFNNPTNLVPLSLKADNNLKRGSAVVAIGSPEGLQNTVSIGNISYQFEEDGKPWIQFTAPISQGSSGGALFNDDGQVIGVTSAIYRSGQNLNFAINISVALAMYNAWDGQAYTFQNFKSSAKMDFSDVYNFENNMGGFNNQDQTTVWACPNCGMQNNTRFCVECGTEKPVWICACGKVNNGKFCGNCGRPVEEMIKEIDQALSLKNQGRYEEAINIFEQLEKFNCVSIETTIGKNISAYEQMKEAYYEWAESSKEQGAEIDTVLSYYQKAEGYKDADQLIITSHYMLGIKYLAEKQYDKALEEFINTGDYSDAKEKIKEAYYFRGMEALENGQYDKAMDDFGLAQDFLDADKRELQCYYEKGKKLLEEKQYLEASDMFKNAGSYLDAEYMVREAIFEDIQSQVDETRKNANGLWMHSTVLLRLEGIKDKNEHAHELYKELSYEDGLSCLKRGLYESAKSHFVNAEDYLDTKERLFETKVTQVKSLINEGSYTRAYNIVLQEENTERPLGDFVIMAIGDSQKAMGIILEIAKGMEYLESYPKGEIEYKAKYEKTVKKIEKLLDLEEDGIIALSEMAEISSLIYPLKEGTEVKKLLEKLSDLGYFSNLSDNHQKYEKGRYMNGIKKAENALGLQVDGLITQEEYDIIMSQRVIAPGKPKNLKATVSGNSVTLSWGEVKGSVFYKVYRGDKLIAETKERRYVDKSIKRKEVYNYYVKACKYTVDGETEWVGCVIKR